MSSNLQRVPGWPGTCSMMGSALAKPSAWATCRTGQRCLGAVQHQLAWLLNLQAMPRQAQAPVRLLSLSSSDALPCSPVSHWRLGAHALPRRAAGPRLATGVLMPNCQQPRGDQVFNAEGRAARTFMMLLRLP